MTPNIVWGALAAFALALLAYAAYAVWHKRQTSARLHRAVFYDGAPYVEPQGEPNADLFEMGSLFVQRAVRAGKPDPSTRILVVSREVAPSGRMRFRLVGQSGKVYTVSVGSTLSCDCPDFLYRPLDRTGTAALPNSDPAGVRHCKHLFFVKSELLRIPPRHDMFVKLGYTDWELAYIAQHANLTAHKASFTILEALDGNTKVVVRDPASVCAICYEPIADQPFCACVAQCRAPFHEPCFADFKSFCVTDGKPVTCPVCRHDWVEAQQLQATLETVGATTYQSVAHLRRGAKPKLSRAGSQAKSRAGSRARA